jgi:hypothetical protein
MTDDQTLLAQYQPLIDAELARIGFAEDDFRYLGSGGTFTRDALEAHLTDLRRIPSDIGAQAYFARYGVDFAKMKRDSSSPPTLPAPPKER